jgi:hypothetical protein
MGLRMEIVLPLVAIATRRRRRATSHGDNTDVDSKSRLAGEDGLDNSLAETFPCSDALSSIPNPST